MESDSALPLARRGRPRQVRTANIDTVIGFNDEAMALSSRIQKAIATDHTIVFHDGELNPVWDGESDKQWRLLRLHRFARTCKASIQREPDGAVRFSAIPDKARPPHFQFVATMSPGLDRRQRVEAAEGNGANELTDAA